MSDASDRGIRVRHRAEAAGRRRVGHRLEPPRPGRRRRSRRARRDDRARLRRPTVPRARLGDGAGDRHRPRARWRRRRARRRPCQRPDRRCRAGGLHADRRAVGARRLRRPHPEHAPEPAAGVPGRARDPRRPAARRGRDRGHGPPRRRDARRRADRRAGGRADPARGRRGDPARAIQAVEHRVLPRVVALLVADALRPAGEDGPASARRPGRRRRGRADAAPRPPVGVGQDGARGPRSWPRRARLGARLDRRHRPHAARRRPAGHGRGGGHGLAGDARWSGQDPAPPRPRRPPGRPTPRRPSRAVARRRDRAVRPRRRQPLPVRGRPGAPGDQHRCAHRGDRHRRAVDGAGGSQEPRQRGDRDRPRIATTTSSPHSTATPASTTGFVASSRSRRSPTPPPTTRGSRPSCRSGSWTRVCCRRPRIRIRRT